jgi:5-methylcytosine-specific restriction enzyme subunit McrC
VGTIVAPGCRLLIRPKIPLPNLCALLEPASIPWTEEDFTAAAPGTELLDLLAVGLARLMTERATAGLHRAYADRMAHGPFLQGRLDLPAQLRDPLGPKDRLHCRFEDFTADVPCNQLPRATAEMVLRSGLLGEAARPVLHRAVQVLARVSSVPLGPELFQAAEPTRLTQAYRPLYDLCRLLAHGLRPDIEAGLLPNPAFLLDMERVFERYVTAAVTQAFRPTGAFEVAVQPSHPAIRPVAGHPDIPMRPDITVNRGGRPMVVIDAKWKRLRGSPVVTDDVYQVLAYCTALGAFRGMLIYPGRRDRLWTYRLEHGPVELDIRTLRVVGARQVCGRSLRRLERAVRSAAKNAWSTQQQDQVE